MLLSIDIFLIVCVCVIVLITRDFIYNKSDSFFRRYIGILYIVGVLIQINIGFVVNHLDINHHYFYLFPVEVFFLSMIYEYLIAIPHYNRKLSSIYASSTIFASVLYFGTIGLIPNNESYWLIAQIVKALFVIGVFAYLFKNYIFLFKKYQFKYRNFAFNFVSLLLVCFYFIFILVGLLLNRLDVQVLFFSKSVFTIITLCLIVKAIYDNISTKKQIQSPVMKEAEENQGDESVTTERLPSITVKEAVVSPHVPIKKYEKSRLKAYEIEKIKLAIDDELIVNKAYLNPDLSLQKLSNQLNITSHNISQVFNLSYQSNFKDYVNKLRCKHAVELLQDSNDKHIIEIAYESGFNSKTSFYRAFNKNYNVNPTEYKLILNQKKQF